MKEDGDDEKANHGDTCVGDNYGVDDDACCCCC